MAPSLILTLSNLILSGIAISSSPYQDSIIFILQTCSHYMHLNCPYTVRLFIGTLPSVREVVCNFYTSCTHRRGTALLRSCVKVCWLDFFRSLKIPDSRLSFDARGHQFRYLLASSVCLGQVTHTPTQRRLLATAQLCI